MIKLISVPSSYLKNIARPALERFANEPTSIELSFSACILIAHFADVLAEHSGRSLVEVRSELGTLNDSYLIVYAFSIAAKHVQVRDKRLNQFIGLRSDNAEVGGSAAFSDGTYFSDGTTYAEHSDVVRIKTPNGSWHDLPYAACSALNALELKYA